MMYLPTSHQRAPLSDAPTAPSFPANFTFDGMQFNADGSPAAAAASGSAAPPSYEALVLDPNGPRSQTNLFVRKLSSAVREKDLIGMFGRYGTILSFVLMRDIHTGESMGTAFVRYSSHDEARAAMEGLDGTELYNRPISIQWAKREHDGTPCGDARRKIRKLFVRNIPVTVTARDLRQIFSPFGPVDNVTLHSDTAPALPRDASADVQAEQTRNIAFVLFMEDGSAERAVIALHNTYPFPSCEGIPLLVKLAENNRDRLDRKHKADGSTLNPAALPQVLMASSGQPGTLSNPVSASISPAQLPLNASMAHVFNAAMMPTSFSQGMPFSVSPGGVGAPMLQATTDANGNTTYMYVTAPAAPQMVSPPASGAYFVQTPTGLQAIPAPVQTPQMATYYTPAPAPMSTPTLQSLPQQSFFSPMAVPPMFFDAQGNPVATMQRFYQSFPPQHLVAQPQPQPQQPQQQQHTPTQKRSSLPSFAEATSTSGQISTMMTPTNTPFVKMTSAVQPRSVTERSLGLQHLMAPTPQQGSLQQTSLQVPSLLPTSLQQPSLPHNSLPQTSLQHPDIFTGNSVSPQLSSAASNANLMVTGGSSAVASPMDAGIAMATDTLQPAYVHSHTLAPHAPAPIDLPNTVPTTTAEDPLVHYDSLRMNNGSTPLMATSSSTGASDLPMSSMMLGFEENDDSESASEASAFGAAVSWARHAMIQ